MPQKGVQGLGVSGLGLGVRGLGFRRPVVVCAVDPPMERRQTVDKNPSLKH